MINEERRRRDVIVIGASAGGLGVLKTIIAALPAALPAAIGVVVHMWPYHRSLLPKVLERDSALPVTSGDDGDTLEQGRIYVAPPDQHMVFDGDRVRLNRGPKQHFTRPAIDPLFLSASDAYGPRAVGVVLSGGGDDGVSGLLAIKQRRGVSIVQDPTEAEFPSMPLSALSFDDVDLSLAARDIACILTALARGERVDLDRPPKAPQGGGESRRSVK